MSSLYTVRSSLQRLQRLSHKRLEQQFHRVFTLLYWSNRSERFFLYWRTPQWSVAVLTTWCQTSPSLQSLAFLQAVCTTKFKDWRSSSIVVRQVVFGRPTDLLQSVGGLSAVAATRWRSSPRAVRARCPKNLSRSDLTARHWWACGDASHCFGTLTSYSQLN